jgi:REP element-mobilizing transposase RayT
MKANTKPLQPAHYYHIYNRGINGCRIFSREKHYALFLSKYAYHISPFADTFAYCLLGNHFHFLVQVKSEEQILKSVEDKYPGKKIVSIEKLISNQFAHLFNGYCQSFNKDQNRTGGLFESQFRRKEVDNDAYFSRMISYIHLNPERHKLVKDFKNYPYSSYYSHLSKNDTKLEQKQVLDWFGGIEGYIKFHEDQRDRPSLSSKLIIEFENIL